MIDLDTSFIAPLYIREATSEAVEAILLNIPTPELAISHWTIVEFSSLLSRRVRMGELSAALMQTASSRLIEDSFRRPSNWEFLPILGDYSDSSSVERVQPWDKMKRQVSPRRHRSHRRSHLGSGSRRPLWFSEFSRIRLDRDIDPT